MSIADLPMYGVALCDVPPTLAQGMRNATKQVGWGEGGDTAAACDDTTLNPPRHATTGQ
jgi:hypothetical protein